MALTNTDKPTTSFSNTVKVSFAELWSTITTTWATETRTWLDTGSLFDNLAKDNIGYLWAATTYPWTDVAPWSYTDAMTNTAKPS